MIEATLARSRGIAEPDVQMRLFGKPDLKGKRRMGVMLAKGDSIEGARQKATRSAARVKTIV